MKKAFKFCIDHDIDIDEWHIVDANAEICSALKELEAYRKADLIERNDMYEAVRFSIDNQQKVYGHFKSKEQDIAVETIERLQHYIVSKLPRFRPKKVK